MHHDRNRAWRRATPVAARAALLVVPLLAPAGCGGRAAYAPPPPLAPSEARAPRAPQAAPDIPDHPLTAAEAVRLALARNPDVASARARVEAAQAGLDGAHAALWPRLSADAGYLRGDAPSAYLFKTIDGRSLAPGTDFNDPGLFDNLEYGASLRWTVWDGGRNLLAAWAASASIDFAQAGRDVAANALVAGVVAAFLEARAAGELIASDEASVKAVESQVAETKVRVEGGGALRSDLLSLEVRLAEARERRIQTDVARRTALATLRHLLALPMGARLELAPGGYDAGLLPAVLADALSEAYRMRPELAAARRAIERARIESDAADRAYLPRLDVEGRLYWDDADADFEGLTWGDRNWWVGVGLSMDLFDGGSREAGRRRAKAALAEAGEADRKALQAVALDVETAYLRLDAARARLDVTSKAVAAAEETFELVEKQFRGGAATVTRYLEAEAARTQARSSAIRARMDVDRAQVDAARSVGRFGGEEAR
jgi:outer membrane protein TolC